MLKKDPLLPYLRNKDLIPLARTMGRHFIQVCNDTNISDSTEHARKNFLGEAPKIFSRTSADMGGMGGLFSDPELLESLSDPEVAAAFEDITSNPANIMKYQGNPKVMKLLTKMAGKMGGGGGGAPGGMGGLGGMFGGKFFLLFDKIFLVF